MTQRQLAELPSPENSTGRGSRLSGTVRRYGRGGSARGAPREESVWVQVRRWVESSPGKLATATVALIVLLLLTGWITSSGQQARSEVINNNVETAEPRLFAAQNLYSSLSAANAAANSSFIAGGIEPDALRQNYLDAIGAAGRSAIAAAAGIDADDASGRDALDRVNEMLPIYTGIIDTARANNRMGNPVGASYLTQASTIMANTLLPAAEDLYQGQLGDLDRSRDTFSRPAYFTFIVLLASFVALIAMSRWIAHRTRRLVNLGLLVALACATTSLLWVVVAGLLSVNSSANANEDGAKTFAALTSARIEAQSARSDETLTLVRRTDNEQRQVAHEQSIAAVRTRLEQITTDDKEVSDAIDSTIGAIDGWDKAYSQFTSLLDAGDYAGASQVAIGTGANSASAQYTVVDFGLNTGIERSRVIYRDSMYSAAGYLSYSGPGVFALMLIGAVATGFGLYPRIREYG